MARNFYTRVATDGGEVIIHVNRRGCKGGWSKECDEALAEMVRALHRMTPEQIRAISITRAPSTEEAKNG